MEFVWVNGYPKTRQAHVQILKDIFFEVGSQFLDVKDVRGETRNFWDFDRLRNVARMWELEMKSFERVKGK